jgi:hypothetical protein
MWLCARELFFRPAGACPVPTFTHGLRRGLDSCAASRLKIAARCDAHNFNRAGRGVRGCVCVPKLGRDTVKILHEIGSIVNRKCMDTHFPIDSHFWVY